MSGVGRVGALQSSMREREVDLVVVAPAANMRYLLDYRAKAAERITVLLVTLDAAAMVMPYFDAGEFREITGLDEVFEWADDRGADRAIEEAFSALAFSPGQAVVAVDDDLSFDFFLQLGDYVGDRPLRASELLTPLRLVKTAEEQERIRRAGKLVSLGIEIAIEQAQPGMTELELKRAVEKGLLETEAESIDTVSVQAGANAAAPHHKADGTRLRQGEAVLIDIAVRVDGYFADMTQQVFLGEPSQEYRDVYDVVTAAEEAGVQATRAGATAGDVDRATAAVIEAAGLRRWSFPRTGHGIGLDGHERPSVVDGDETELVPGTAITVEPGIYIPGKFGVRVEDTVIVTEAGPERVTDAARPLPSKEDAKWDTA